MASSANAESVTKAGRESTASLSIFFVLDAVAVLFAHAAQRGETLFDGGFAHSARVQRSVHKAG